MHFAYTGAVPTIQVREVPEHIYKTLSEAAKRERRSLAQQVIVTLERGLSIEDHKQRRRELFEEIRRRGPIKTTLDIVAEIRKDRER